MSLPLVIIESPFSAKTARGLVRNHNFAKAALHHSITLHEIPFLSHLFYTQFLSDKLEEDRRLGMEAGWALYERCDFVAVYIDLGFSYGMVAGIERAARLARPIVYREINWLMGDK